jgi:hypothetical protein
MTSEEDGHGRQSSKDRRPGIRKDRIPGTHGQNLPLSDIGKAVRCLINYARENSDKQNEIFDEVRCLDC